LIEGKETAVDWNAAIGRQRGALVGILATLVAMAAGGASTLPRRLHRAVLRLLRPAEAAARRLVIAEARRMVVPPPPPRGARPRAGRRPDPGARSPSPVTGRGSRGVAEPAAQKLSLPLFDPLRKPVFAHRPRRRGSSGVPRISVPGFGNPFPVAVRCPPSPDDPIDATRLRLRLQALAAALDDLPAQARRFARWQARLTEALAQERNAAGAHGKGGGVGAPKIRRVWPLKPGRPPGWRRKSVHEVDEVLKDAHWLAVTALDRRDTS
jgi:hypothetical protein